MPSVLIAILSITHNKMGYKEFGGGVCKECDIHVRFFVRNDSK